MAPNFNHRYFADRIDDSVKESFINSGGGISNVDSPTWRDGRLQYPSILEVYARIRRSLQLCTVPSVDSRTCCGSRSSNRLTSAITTFAFISSSISSFDRVPLDGPSSLIEGADEVAALDTILPACNLVRGCRSSSESCTVVSSRGGGGFSHRRKIGH